MIKSRFILVLMTLETGLGNRNPRFVPVWSPTIYMSSCFPHEFSHVGFTLILVLPLSRRRGYKKVVYINITTPHCGMLDVGVQDVLMFNGSNARSLSA